MCEGAAQPPSHKARDKHDVSAVRAPSRGPHGADTSEIGFRSVYCIDEMKRHRLRNILVWLYQILEVQASASSDVNSQSAIGRRHS